MRSNALHGAGSARGGSVRRRAAPGGNSSATDVQRQHGGVAGRSAGAGSRVAPSRGSLPEASRSRHAGSSARGGAADGASVLATPEVPMPRPRLDADQYRWIGKQEEQAAFSVPPLLGVLTTKSRRGSQAPSWATATADRSSPSVRVSHQLTPRRELHRTSCCPGSSITYR